MQRYFISSSGTGVGKTTVTAALASQWHARGTQVRAIKPVATGVMWKDEELSRSDMGVLAQAMGLEPNVANCKTITFFDFFAPLAPAMAAMEENRELSLQAIVDACKHAETGEVLLVEGIGGVMAPLTRRYTVLDWMQALQYPVILVVGSYLGAISHALTAYRALESVSLTVALVVVNQSEECIGLEQTCAMMQAFMPSPLVAVPRVRGKTALWKELPDLVSLLQAREAHG